MNGHGNDSPIRRLENVCPQGEATASWGEEFSVTWQLGGLTESEASRILECDVDELDPVWLRGYDQCPSYEEGPDGCCFGNCDGGPVWQAKWTLTPGWIRGWATGQGH